MGSGRNRARYIEVGGGGSPASGGGNAKYACITAHAGTEAPYLYSGYEARWNGSAWVAVTDGDTFSFNLRNAQEQASLGTGAAPLPDSSIVQYGFDASDNGVCWAVNQPGVYP